MAISLETLALAKAYVKQTLENAGSLKGANCTIKSIAETGDGNIVTFQWEDNNGTVQTSTMTIKNGTNGKDGSKGAKGDTGTSITGVTVNSSKHLIITLSDNSTIDAGLVPTVSGKNGTNGKDGKNGTDGKSVTAIDLVKDDTGLIVSGIATLSDGSTIDIGITTA